MTVCEPQWDEVVSNVVEILLQLGERRDAERILAFYSATATAERWRLSASVELRCHALLSALDGDLEEALELLDGAVRRLDAEPWSLQLGRTLLARGSLLLLLARPPAARPDLDRAFAIFTHYGSAGWRLAALRTLVSTVDAAPWHSTTTGSGIVFALTGGVWADREITGWLRRSLQVVERRLPSVEPQLLARPTGEPE
jgi:tetratricopeptide (TPR) repeat protein